jgi:hypothetical protein
MTSCGAFYTARICLFQQQILELQMSGSRLIARDGCEVMLASTQLLAGFLSPSVSPRLRALLNHELALLELRKILCQTWAEEHDAERTARI